MNLHSLGMHTVHKVQSSMALLNLNLRLLRQPCVFNTKLQHRSLQISQSPLSSAKDSGPVSINAETFFSEANKLRCQHRMQSVLPIRKVRPSKLKDMKQAGVLVPMCIADGQPSILFTLRSSHLNSHKGEVSFPGGKRDDDDDHIIDTALREAEEEVGLDRSLIQVWGPLSPVPSRPGTTPTATVPVLAYCGELTMTSLKPNPQEVSEIFTRTISSLCDPRNNRYTYFTNGYTLPVFLGGAHRIWGLSAVILYQVLNVIAPEHYSFRFSQF